MSNWLFKSPSIELYPFYTNISCVPLRWMNACLWSWLFSEINNWRVASIAEVNQSNILFACITRTDAPQVFEKHTYIVIFMCIYARSIGHHVRFRIIRRRHHHCTYNVRSLSVLVYLVYSYVYNYIPWLVVLRCCVNCKIRGCFLCITKIYYCISIYDRLCTCVCAVRAYTRHGICVCCVYININISIDQHQQLPCWRCRFCIHVIFTHMYYLCEFFDTHSCVYEYYEYMWMNVSIW